MTIIVGGHETGLLDSSQFLLNRNDRSGNTEPGHGEQPYVNVSNGNLLIQQIDAFLPSLGDDYLLVRTYNARARPGDPHQHDDARWSLTTTIRLDVLHAPGGERYFEIEYGDGSTFDYWLDSATGLYVSTDGAGAFEVIEDLGTTGNDQPSFILTRADQTQLSFDSQGHLLQLVNTNGVTVDYIYASDRLQQVIDDQGHVLNYIYENGRLASVTDETEAVLVEYLYDSGRLSEVIDRHGHSTQYFYTNNGFLNRIVLPDEQIVDGQLESYGTRELNFQYDTVTWGGNQHVVTQITDAAGGITTFEYDFDLVNGNPNNPNPGNGNGRGNGRGNGQVNGVGNAYGHGNGNGNGPPVGGNVFRGGSTRVVDALGNNRAYSNDQEYVDWRTANGYYATYDAVQAGSNPSYQAQVDAVRNLHALTYAYDEDGYITEVIDQQGFRTAYVYDDQDNLISITDRNGWGATNSDSDYYRTLRAELGIVDGAGNGKQVASLNQQEIDAILEAYTTHFAYDDRGNLIQTIDNADNVTTFTYTSFNKLESTTTAVGNALVTSDEQQYQDLRVELGYSALVAGLSAGDIQVILDLHTTNFEYDANQNLTERRDPGGDISRFEYDSSGNLIRQIVFLDANDLVDPAKQQVTTFAYDGFGNNVSVTDAEGNQTFSIFDHFGNLTRFTDARGGVTHFSYDADNRLLTVTDPEGHLTVNTYDAVGNRTSITDADGHTITRVYDLSNNLIASIDPSNFDPASDRVTQFEYDVTGNRTATVDAEGRRTELTFNTRRELVEILTEEVADQNGNLTRYLSTLAYDGESNVITSTNNRGFTTEFIYSRNNLVRQQTDPDGQITRIEYDANNNQISITAGMQLAPAMRQVLRFRFDEENQIVRQTDAEGNITEIAYDAPGNRIGVTDANGNTTEFEFDANNRLVREILPEVIDPVSGSPVRYTVEHIFDANGNEIETIDQNGNSIRFSYDLDDRLVMVEDQNNVKTIFQYDSRHNRTSILIGADATADVNGLVTINSAAEANVKRFVYDEFNQLIATIDGVGVALAENDSALYQALRLELGYASLVADLSAADQAALRELYTERYTYDRVSNLLTRTDNLDRTTSFDYDSLNRQVSITDALNQISTRRYDGNSNATSSVDELGRVSSFVYDSVDQLVDATDPVGVTTHFEYDSFDNLTAATRAFGTVDARTSTFEYDLNNRLIAQTDPEAHTQSFEYDAVGNRIRLTDARGNSTEFFFNALNRNIRILDPLSFETSFEYDGVGNRISLIDARAGITRFAYDPGSRLISTTDAEGRISEFAYDVRGNRIEMRTGAGTADEEVTLFEYDVENNLRRIVDAEGGITEADFDRVYNQVAGTDARGNMTASEFDALNRIVRVTDAENQVTEFAYDAVDNLLTRTDALGRITTLAYDANDRLIREIASNGVETHFTFDLVGNQASITRAANTADNATTTFLYDLDDRLVSQTDAEGNVTTFTYDENDNRTLVTDPNGNVTQFQYDAKNQLVQITDAESNTVLFSYDGNGNRNQVVDGRGNVSTTYYNANNEVSVSVNPEGFATSFLYDNNGNVVSQTLHMQALSLPLDPSVIPSLPATPADQTVRFEYDNLNRVTARIDGEDYRSEFVYDAVGNRIETRIFRDLAGTDNAVTYNYFDSVNRQIASVTAEGYLLETVYDAVGNVIERTLYDERVTVPATGLPAPIVGDVGRIQTFEYDLVDRQVRAVSALGVETEFEYDDRGNRTALINAAGTADQRRTEFSFDDADRLTDTTDALGTVTHFDLDGNGNVVARFDAFGTVDQRQTTFAYDGNNRNVTTTDATGVVTQFSYDANGNLVATQFALGLTETRTETREYDANNRVSAEINGENERSEFSYDGAGNRIAVLQAPGLTEVRLTQFEYDRDNRLVAEIDGVGVRSEFRYDGADNRIEIIEAVGVAAEERHTFLSYDLDNRLLQTTDPLTGVVQYEYDVLGNRLTVTDQNGGVQTNTYDIIGRLVSSLSAGGTLTQNTYDLRNNVTSSEASFNNGTDSRLTVFQYDLLDRVVLATNPNGYSTEMVYDVFGNQVQTTRGQYLVDPLAPEYDANLALLAVPQTTQSVYDAVDRLVAFTDAQGVQRSISYDAIGNRISQIDGANINSDRLTTYSYDLANRLVETVTPEGGITQNTYNELGQLTVKSILQSEDGVGNQVWIENLFEYDDNGRVTARVDGEGVRSEFSYDAVGNQIAVRSAVGGVDERVTTTEYDLNNRVVAETDGEGNRAEFEYDSIGNRIQATDARGNSNYFYYDADNRLISMLNAEGHIRESSYDSAGNRIALREYFGVYTGAIDPFVAASPPASALDRVTSFTYDGEGQLVSRVEADGATYQFTYDGVGNLAAELDSLGRQTVYGYDLNNRLTSLTDANGVETQYGYDFVGNRTSIVRAANTADATTELFSYDLNNRLVQEVDGLGNARLTFEYDRADNQTVELDANGNAFSFSYDLNNRLTDFADGVGNVTTFVYDDLGNVRQEIDGRNNVEIKFYNANDQVTHRIDREGYVTTYQYDQNGNVVSQIVHMTGLSQPIDPAVLPTLAPNAADQTTTFEYDALNRVAARIDAEGYRTEFVYDAAGNQTQLTQFRNIAGTEVSVVHQYFDAMNREVARISAEGYLTTFSYDLEGNRVGRTRYDQTIAVPASGVPTPQAGDNGRVESFVYDSVDRLLRSTSVLGVHTDFEYDERGNRTATVQAVGTVSERRTAVSYDAANRIIDTTDALGIVSHFSRDANGNVVQQRDAFGTAAERLTTFVYDGNNRVINQTDAIGVVTNMTYDANGNLISTTAAAGLAEQRTESFEYDGNNRLTAEVNGEGERTESIYDGAGNRVSLILAPGLAEERLNTFEFDSDNRLVAAVDGEGVRTEYRYDGVGNKIETIQGVGLAGEERHSFYNYDLDNRLVQVTDPLGGVTQYTYDVLGNQTHTVNANGGQQTSTFDALGQLLTNLSAGNILTVNTYDQRGNVVSTTQSFGDGTDTRSTSYVYDLLDRQIQLIDPEGFSTSINYDAFGNQTLVTHGQYLLLPGDAGYDAGKAARVFEQTNAFAYDAADRLTSLTDAEGNITLYGYDAVGNRIVYTEASNSAGRTTSYAYDLANRLIETVTPEGGITRNSYNEAGNRISESVLQSDDGITQVWSTRSFEYDANAMVVAHIDSYGVRTEFEYDAMGNQTVARSAAGTADERVTRQEYDLNNRVSAEIDGENNRAEFAYDSLGNRIQVTDALGRVARFYFDSSNNLTGIFDAEGYVNAFEYDSAGNRTTETIFMTRYTGPVDDFVAPTAVTSVNDRFFTSVFDGNSRVVQRIDSDQSVTAFDYDAAGNLLREVQFANSAAPRELFYSYDLNNRLTVFTDVDGSITTFTYDGSNNKTSETISNVSDPNASRQTTFEYDLNNRLIQETFDPAGLNLVQSTEYDLASNAISQTNANGDTTRLEYDLNNRVVRRVDSLNNDSLIAYDAVGNQISVTDANGNMTTFTYDNNNRVVLETLPEVSVYTIDSGVFTAVQPTVTHLYDAAGNEIQSIDPAGNITTRYFDSNDRLAAEINGDNVLREWTYNAAGEQISETMYMTRLGAAAHDPNVRPAAPAGEARTISRQYDLGGRVTVINYPGIEVTTLVDANTSNPTFTTAVVQPEELITYDIFGNQIEFVDRNGNRTLSYYDAKDRLVAQVDGTGYLIEFDYDSQDNVLEQRIYTQTLDVGTLDPQTRPVAPAGDFYQTNRIYDAASRLIEEHSPQVEVFNPSTLTTTLERVITIYTYDGLGNQTSRTLASGSPQELTEYTYFDALGRQVAVIDGNRVVNVFGYDANGNQSLATRYFNTVAGGVDLTTLTGETNFAALVGSNSNDQQLQRLYDALNRISSETELMGAGSADDLIQSFGYDANGKRTLATDEDGFTQQFSYDGMGNLTRSVGSDNSGTVYENDAAGNQIFAFTGQLDSIPLPASNINATLGDALNVGWNLPAGANVQSYVVYDIATHSDINNYANQSTVQGTWFEAEGSVSLATAGFVAGDTVYFRVVTRDTAGSLTWTAEQSVTLPPRIDDIAVAQVGTDSLEITVQFDASASNPSLAFGMPGSTNTIEAMTDLGGGLYRVTLTGITNPQELAYRIQWQDAGGAMYASDELPFEAQGQHLGLSSQLSESTLVIGPDTFYRVNVDSTLPAAFAGDLLGVSATWVSTTDPSNSGSTSVEGVDSGLGFFDFPIVVGAGDNPLAAGTYTVVLRAVGETEDTILDSFEVTVGSGLISGTQRSVSWNSPGVGDSQVVVIDGQRATALRENGRLVVDPGFSAVGSVDYSVFYGNAFADTHTTTVTSTEITDVDNSTMPPTVTSLGYDVNVSTALSAAEAANVAGDVHLAWRSAGSGTEFANDVILTAGGSTYDTTLALLAAGEYDLKVYYLDSNGDEVIVDWVRIDTAIATVDFTDNSVTVSAMETDGDISLSADEVVTIDPGLYSGPLDTAISELTLQTVLEDVTVGSIQQDGSGAGYFVDNRYDALNNLTATNGETGVWREFGVDALGNRVVTRSFGVEGAPTPVVSYTAYDARNREIAQFSPEVGGQQAVQRFEYNFQDNTTLITDALGGQTRRTWNALGSQLTEQDQLFNTTTFRYDRLGRRTAEIDPLGNSQYKFYDNVGNLTQSINGEGDAVNFSYDVFGRRTQVSNALGQAVSMTYDQRDRLVAAQDALGATTSYEYDGRDNRTRTVDANGNESRQVWDGLGRVSQTITFQNGQQITERKQYDSYGNLIAEVDGAGRITSSIYGEFGRLLQRVDSGGRVTTYEYDDQGRLIREMGLNTGKDIRRSYDEAGRLIEVDDVATGVKTVYTYDLKGNRLTEAVTTPANEHNRNVSYQYDAVGQMLRWADAVTGMHTNYMWDSGGNLARAFTDLGYDPDGESLSPTTRFIDHDYSYDGNNLVTQRTQRGAIEVQYSYDAAGNRVMVNQAGTITDYFFDASGRAIRAESGGTTTADWLYDDVGNITRFRTYDAGGAVDTVTTKQYYENNRNHFTNDDGQQTTLTMNGAGDVTRTKLVDDGNTFYFDHIYNAAGLETRINARGDDVGGRTINTYDANDNLVVFDKGEGDNQDRPEILRFVYNNDGQILYRFNDTGEGSDIFETEFAYAGRNPVGQTGATEDIASETLLDTGKYNLVKELGEDFPNGAVTFVTASAGDTLQGIASAVYGNPSLWFVLAEANGIAPGERLSEGQRLQVPNTVRTGELTAETHVVYDEGDIIGSTLPNLKSEPSDGGCGGFLAIIIIIVIAVVAIVATGGLATAFLGGAQAALTASLGAQIAAFTLAGAIVGAAASIVQQGLFIALGYQDEFSWRSVAAGAVSGALQGTAQGVSFAANVGTIANLRFAKVAASALKVASTASKQYIESGRITSWASLATAALGKTDSGVRLEDGTKLLLSGLVSDNVLSYVTPWATLAETAIRNNGELTPADWTNAVSATLSSAFASDGKSFGGDTLFGKLGLADTQSLINFAAGGALSLFDRSAGLNFIANAVGSEVGSLIGNQISSLIGQQGLTRATLAAAQTQNEQRRKDAAGMPNDVAASPVQERLDTPKTSVANDSMTDPANLEETPLQGTMEDADGDQVESQYGTREVKKGDTFWKIAKEQLGPNATNEDIQRQSQILMELNAGTEPGKLRVGQEIIIVAPFSGIEVSPETLALYQSSNAEVQEFLINSESPVIVPTADEAEEELRNTLGFTLDELLLEEPTFDPRDLSPTELAIAEKRLALVQQLNQAIATNFGLGQVEDPEFLGEDFSEQVKLVTKAIVDDALEGFEQTAEAIATDVVRSNLAPNLEMKGNLISNIEKGVENVLNFFGGDFDFETEKTRETFQGAADLLRDGVADREGFLSQLEGTVKLVADIAGDEFARGVIAEFIPNFVRSLPAQERAQLFTEVGIGVGAIAVTQGRSLVNGVLKASKGVREALESFVSTARRIGKPNVSIPSGAALGNFSRTVAANAKFLKNSGIADAGLRRKIIEAGFRSDLLGADTPFTNARFNKLFPDTVASGKQFKGRLGNIATRVATINKAAELERGGLIPDFEFPVVVGDGKKRFVDLVGLDPETQGPVQFIQFVKESPSGVVIRTDEILAARQIENALNLSENTVQLINTGN